MNRRPVLVSGVLAAFLLTPAISVAQEPDCSKGGPPTGSVQVTGPQVRVGDRLVAGSAARIEVTATDAAGGPARWTPVIDGQEQGAWPASWTAGEHTAGAVAVDGCGRRTTLGPVAFMVDAEPPTLRWETGEPQIFVDTNRLAPDSEKDRRRRRNAKKDGRPADDSWLSEAGVLQVPLPWVRSSDPTFLARASYPVQIRSDHPQAFLAAPGTIAVVDGSDSGLGERLLWITAEDAGAGVEGLTLRIQNEGDRAVLQVEVTDQVGTTSRKEIVLRRQGQTAR